MGLKWKKMSNKSIVQHDENKTGQCLGNLEEEIKWRTFLYRLANPVTGWLWWGNWKYRRYHPWICNTFQMDRRYLQPYLLTCMKWLEDKWWNVLAYVVYALLFCPIGIWRRESTMWSIASGKVQAQTWRMDRKEKRVYSTQVWYHAKIHQTEACCHRLIFYLNMYWNKNHLDKRCYFW